MEIDIKICGMPVKSQAQREFLNWKFGHEWVKRHHFGQKGKLPMHKKKKQMSDSSKLVQLAVINKNLDGIIQFAYDDENDKTFPYVKPALAGAGLVGAGVGGTLAHQAIKASGGYSALGRQAGVGYSLGRTMGSTVPYGQLLKGAAGDIGKAPAASLGVLAGATTTKAGSLLSRMGKFLKPAAKALESKEKMIRLDEKILEPFGAAGPPTKITQEQFPAGKSPGYQRDPTAEILKLPFPELMRLLKQRNILQQQFSKLGKLVQLGSRIDGILKFASDIHRLTGNVYTSDSDQGLYTRASDVKKGSDILNYPHLRHGNFIKIVNRQGRPTYESRGQAKAAGAIGGGILGAPVGALAQMAITRKPHLGVGAIAGGLAGSGVGYLHGRSKTLPQDQG